MTTEADDFNRANANTLGTGWSNLEGTGMDVASNQAISPNDTTWHSSIRSAVYGNDQEVTVTITGQGPSKFAGIVLIGSGSDGNATLYRLVIGANSTGIGNNLFYEQYVASSYSEVDRAEDIDPPIADGSIVRVRQEGNVVTVWDDEVEIWSTSDPDNTITSGKPGISRYSDGETGLTFDNFSATDDFSAPPVDNVTVDYAQAVFQGQAVIAHITVPLIAAQAAFEGQNISTSTDADVITPAAYAQAAFEPQNIFFIFGTPADGAEATFEPQEISFLLRYKFFFADATFEGQTVGAVANFSVIGTVQHAEGVFAGSNIGLTGTSQQTLDDMVQDDRTIVRPMSYTLTDTDR